MFIIVLHRVWFRVRETGSGFFVSFDAPHDPKELGLICLVKKSKIHFRILLDLKQIINTASFQCHAIQIK